MSKTKNNEDLSERMKGDRENQEKTATRIIGDNISRYKVRFGKYYGFVADWQMTNKNEDNEGHDVPPIEFSF